MSHHTSTTARPVDETWQEIEELVGDLARLARDDVSPRDFYTPLLDGAVQSLAAAGGAVWLIDSGGRPALEYQTGLHTAELAPDEAGRTAHLRLIQICAGRGEPRIAAPQSGSSEPDAAGNPTDSLLILCPIRLDGETLGVLEIVQRPDTSHTARQGFLRFLTALCELAGDFHGNRRLRQMRDRATLWGQFQQFAQRAHGSLDVDATAYVLANEGRQLIGCDRLSVAVRRGSKQRLRAVSGIDRFDRRSNLVRRLDGLIHAVARTGEPLWHTGEPSSLPPQIERPLHDYLDESHARLLAVIPLPEPESDRPGAPLGVLVVEQFDSSQAGDALRQRTEAVARQSAAALRGALEHQSIPGLPLLMLMGRLLWFLQLRQLPRTVAALLLLGGMTAALALVPADFEIGGTAELQPRLRRDVFATADGVVREVLVDQNCRVTPDSVVVRLRNSELDFQLSQLLGDIQTTRKELDTVQISLRAASPNAPEERAKYNQLAARELELKSRLESLDRQLAIVRNQLAALEVHSPIAGQVLTWDLHKRLDARPVTRGQVLMTVADVDGPWVVEIEVADEHIGHVLDARRELRENLPVEFLLASNPGVTLVGEIDRVSRRAEPGESGGPSVLVVVRFDKEQLPEARPGASVVPRIHCGRRPIGYVWFHELLEAVQKRLLF